jgi:HD-GYP domain-containing protein (c-di-GMP phosphodiesterase class II)
LNVTGDPRVLLVGGDASASIALSMALGVRANNIIVPTAVDVGTILSLGATCDAVVVVTDPRDTDPMASIEVVARSGLQKRAVILAEHDDQQIAAASISLGFRGYLSRGAPPEHLARAVLQVMRQGAIFDPPAAALLGSPGDKATNLMGSARALAAALEMKDTYTGGHAERVTSLALRLTRAVLGDESGSEALEASFLLHDVGKIGIPDQVLTKPGALTVTERRILETHPILGEKIIAPLGFPDTVGLVVRHHHERWDGTGYPDRLAGEDIPLCARIFAIADVIDAMTSIRPYRQPVRFEQAIAEIEAHAGAQFDPALASLVRATFLGQPVRV